MKKSTRQKPTAYRIFALFKKLSISEKLEVVNQLEDETREKRWDHLTEKLSRSFCNNSVSDNEITRIVEEVRKEQYERNQNRT